MDNETQLPQEQLSIWVNCRERMPVDTKRNCDYPMEFLVRTLGDDPRSGWIDVSYFMIDDLAEYLKSGNYCEWLDEDIVTTYAKKYYKLEQENEQLKRWKAEAAETLSGIIGYAHKNLEVGLGQSITEAVLKHIESLKAQSDKMAEVLLKFRVLRGFWFPYGEVKPEHENEAVALKHLSDELDTLIADYQGKKEGL